MVGRGAANAASYCPRPILRGVWRVRVQPHFRIRDRASFPPHNWLPHLSGLLFLANIKKGRLTFFSVGLSDALREVNSFVRSQNIQPASRQPDFPVYNGGHAGGRLADQSSHITFWGAISIFRKRLSPSGTPIHSGKIIRPATMSLFGCGIGCMGK